MEAFCSIRLTYIDDSVHAGLKILVWEKCPFELNTVLKIPVQESAGNLRKTFRGRADLLRRRMHFWLLNAVSDDSPGRDGWQDHQQGKKGEVLRSEERRVG